MSVVATIEKVDKGLKFTPTDGAFVGQCFEADCTLSGNWSDVWKCKRGSNFVYIFQELDILRWVNS